MLLRMSLQLYTSNRMEELAAWLTEVVRVPQADAFAPEIIVVQSRGMDRWLAQRLADAHGVCANCSFPFPNALIGDLFESVLPGQQSSQLFDRSVMLWRILGLLDDFGMRYAEIGNYIAGGGLRSYQLARSLADLFDQYMIFRPDMLQEWSRGKLLHGGPEVWQAELWRALLACGADHRAAMTLRLLESFDTADNLPERISLFGISYLPPLFLEVFARLSAVVEVNVFALNPCREYWGDIVSEKEKSKIDPDLYLEVGNPILASLGRQGRYFFDALSEHDAGQGGSTYHQSPETLLGTLQNDILDLREPASREPDGTLIVQNCHSAMRELEVLHDQLLEMLQLDATLRPEDIIVMAPDIELYAPLVGAVMNSEPALPYNIADRSFASNSQLAETYLALLGLKGSRLPVSEVLGLLEREAIKTRLDWGSEELEQVERWLHATNICWGRDAEHKAGLGLPAIEQNTWRSGLQRMLMGYAAEGDFCAGILPYAVSDVELLGELLDFCEALFSFVLELDGCRTLREWQDLLLGCIDSFMDAGPDGADELQRLRDAMIELGGMQQLAGFEQPLELEVVCAALNDRFSSEVQPGGFISGGITFCSMLPMRSIPFKVICLLGLNHDSYPRRARPRGFDMLARHPRRGDRSKRDDDLYLFLETILAARQKLYLSFVGQGIRDNAKLPPSVLVSDLLDYMKNYSDEELETRQCLQAFSPAYFGPGSRLFSYSRSAYLGAAAILRGELDAGEEWPLGEPPAEFRRLSLDDLVRFFRAPCAYLLERRLGARSVRAEELPLDREPFSLSGLEGYQVRRQLLEVPGDINLLKARGMLPHGTPGQSLAERQVRELAPLNALRDELQRGGGRVELELKLAGFEISGAVQLNQAGQYVRLRPAGIKAKDRLEVWLRLLVLAAAGHPVSGICVGYDRGVQQEHLDAPPASLLPPLLELYWQGLSRPLKFFPESSAEFARTMLKSADEAKAFAAARKKFSPNYSDAPRECDDWAVRRCFPSDPLDREFAELAMQIFGAVLK